MHATTATDGDARSTASGTDWDLSDDAVRGDLDPDRWAVSGNKPNRVALLDRVTGRSIEAFPSPDRDGWKVIGLAEYGPGLPTMEDGVTLDEALETMQAEADAVVSGDPTVGDASNTGLLTPGDDSGDADETDTDGTAPESGGQATLDAFGGGDGE